MYCILISNNLSIFIDKILKKWIYGISFVENFWGFIQNNNHYSHNNILYVLLYHFKASLPSCNPCSSLFIYDSYE